MPPRAIYEHSGPAELVLEGENLTPETLKLYHNGVLYTPLESSDTYAYYVLGDNGTNKVMLNGTNFCTVIVKDVVVPNGLPTQLRAYRAKTSSASYSPENNTEELIVESGNCINYPKVVNEEFPNFLMRFYLENAEVAAFGLTNGNIIASNAQAVSTFLNVRPTDPSKPAYITYQGFIIAVFNYSA